MVITTSTYESRESHILPVIVHSSLISIGKLCDAGCESRFNQHTMAVTKDKHVVLHSKNDVITGLCRVPIQSFDRPKQQSNKIHQVSGKKIPSSIYMRQHLAQYTIHGKEPVIGDISTHGLESRQKTSTRCLRLRPKSRAI